MIAAAVIDAGIAIAGFCLLLILAGLLYDQWRRRR